MRIIFIDIKGIAHNKFILIGQTVNSACYCDVLWRLCVKTSPLTLVKKELAVVSQQCTVSHFLFNQGIFAQKQHDCRPPPTLLFSLSLIEDKTERATF
jgi:hypothetical protein